jgi:hypothetical protein
MTIEDMDKVLSNNFDGVETYDDIEFFDGANFKNLERSTKRFSIKLENKSETTDKVVVLTPGYFNVARPNVWQEDGADQKYFLADGTEIVEAGDLSKVGQGFMTYDSISEFLAAGIQVDAMADDGRVSEHVYCSSTTKERSIRNFLKYIEKNPTLFAGLQITSNNTDLYESSLVLRRTTPYAIYGEEVIPFQDAFRSENSNDKKIVLMRPFQFDGETIATLRIPAKTVATLSFIASGVATVANVMKERTEKAVKNYKRSLK